MGCFSSFCSDMKPAMFQVTFSKLFLEIFNENYVSKIYDLQLQRNK